MIYELKNESQVQKKVKKVRETTKFNTIVIGGGLTGLITALIIATRGTKTLIVDKNDSLGGYYQTYTRIHQKNEYNFDCFWPLDLSESSETKQLLNNLEVGTKIKTILPKVKFELILPSKTPIIFQNNWKNNVAQLKQLYSLSSREIEEFFQELKKCHESYDYFQEYSQQFKTAKDVIDKYFIRDNNICYFFESFWIFFYLPYSELDAKIFIYNMTHYLIGGFHFVEGYSRKFIGVLEEQMISLGSNVKKSSKALQLNTKGDEVKSLLVLMNNSPKKINASRFVAGTSMKNIANSLLSTNKTTRVNNYRNFANNDEKALVENYILVGLKNHPKVFKIFSPVYNIMLSLGSKSNWNFLEERGYQESPILIFNQNEIYPHDANKKTGALFIKICKMNNQFFNKEEISLWIEKQLIRYFPLIKGNIEFIEVLSQNDIKSRIGDDNDTTFGKNHTHEFGWNKRPFATPMQNLIASNIDGFPGGRGNSAILTSAFSCSAINVTLRKRDSYTAIDHYSPKQLVDYIAKNYQFVEKHLNKTIGFTLDERYHYQIKLTRNAAVVREMPFDSILQSTYFVWAFSAVLKDLLTGRSTMKVQVASNKIRVKGGAVYFSKVLRECFGKAFLNSKKTKKTTKD
ncbi:hypothetical protein ASO20_00600 [Mycoplasma sp. (ex Biomphalaria glabrata)]|uniref:NAD(P)-binding protein n=1 Tax=Mycoplasma sp. (ex Biomphalaria glabrata) TaxID=1749074 RepID=UPI00073AAD1B|nr:FAD/NAD(P)-binding protein [Mycoplasma sp. (ex Biomphalaria glabrata)]ALV23176.1 hypothetical protein ASO20_00600 [Mycoplasma sp. (ex Biomphalaria glabrata)]